jgi:Protein of unknown function (DUF4235)
MAASVAVFRARCSGTTRDTAGLGRHVTGGHRFPLGPDLPHQSHGLLDLAWASRSNLASGPFARVVRFRGVGGWVGGHYGTGARQGSQEILLAAALQGVIFALIKAVFERAAAEGVREVTGDWPGEEGESSAA